MLNTLTMNTTIEAALKLSEIILNIISCSELTYKERYDLIDDILTSPYQLFEDKKG